MSFTGTLAKSASWSHFIDYYAANGGNILNVYVCTIWINFRNKIISDKIRENEI